MFDNLDKNVDENILNKSLEIINNMTNGDVDKEEIERKLKESGYEIVEESNGGSISFSVKKME